MERELAYSGYAVRHEKFDRFDTIRKAIDDAPNLYGVLIWGLSEELWNDIARFLDKICASKKNRFPVVAIGANVHAAHRDVAIVSRGHATTVVARAIARFASEGHFRRIVFFHDGRLTQEFVTDAMLFKLHGELAATGCAIPLNAWVIENSSIDEWCSRSIARFGEAWIREVMRLAPAQASERLRQTTRIVNTFVAPRERPRNELWVFSRDCDAVMALEWAADMRFRIPDDVSVVGLQNDAVYYHREISCCIPDYDCLGYLMAHALIGDVPIQRTQRGFLQMQATWLHRSTTRQASRW